MSAKRPDNYAAKLNKTVDNCGICVKYLTRLGIGNSPILNSRRKSCRRVLFVGVGFYDSYTGNSIGKYRGNRRASAPYTAVEWRYLLSEYSRSYYYEGDGNEGVKGQLGVDHEHYDNDTDKLEELYHYFLCNTEHKCLNGRRITAYSVNYRTRRGLIVKPHGQILRFFVNVTSELCDYLITRNTEHISSQARKNVVNYMNAYKEHDYRRKRSVIGIGKYIINEALGKQRGQERNCRCDYGNNYGDYKYGRFGL